MKTIKARPKQQPYALLMIRKYRFLWKAVAAGIMLLSGIAVAGSLGPDLAAHAPFLFLYAEIGCALLAVHWLEWYQKRDSIAIVQFLISLGGIIELVRIGVPSLLGLDIPVLGMGVVSRYAWEIRLILVIGCCLWTVSCAEILAKTYKREQYYE